MSFDTDDATQASLPPFVEVELVYHASAAGSGTDTYVRYMNDVYNDAVAVVHDQPLPTFE